MRERVSVVIAVAVLIVSGLLVFTAVPVSAASRTWTSDAHFSGGMFSQTVISGTGTAASIELDVDPMYAWVQKTPVVGPSPRIGPALTYDAQNGVILMFGGLKPGSVYSNELWKYNVAANTWTNATPVTSPGTRWKAGFSYDPVEHVAVLYGGLNASGSRTDIWEYDVTAGTWAPISPSGQIPRPMESTPLTYDSVIDKHILAGAELIPPGFKTWAYDAAADAWSNLNPGAPIPDLRGDHSLTFDQVTLKTILFGGAEGLTVFGDVWEYNSTSNSWKKTLDWTPNVTPNKRKDHAMAFGPNSAVSLMFGGFDDSGGYPPETWYYISENPPGPPLWIQMGAGGTPPQARMQHAFAWDSANDVVVMFGGLLSDGSTYTNQTWQWTRGYYNAGQYEPATFDAGCPAPNFTDIWWNETKPALTTVRFKFASSDNVAGPFNFTGPDGMPGTFYDTPGTSIWTGDDGHRYSRWKVYLTTNDRGATPKMDDVTLNYECPAAAPFVDATDPANGATGVALDADIIVTFSEAMVTASVNWSISPLIGETASWNAPTDTVLTFTHATPFDECTDYTVQITGGRDKDDGFDLVAGPVPNPWTFRTVCINPTITNTVPADGATGVAVDADIIVTFSEAMDTPTVAWDIAPTLALTDSWNSPTDTVLTLSHTTPFANCTTYTVNVTAGKDLAGLDLVSGAVPNPWSFTVFCPNPQIMLTNPANGATGVPVDADIVVTFTQPMDTPTVRWTISPLIALNAGWNAPTDTVLTLSHTTPFRECTQYTVTITAGQSKAGLSLVAGPVPNPWIFVTECVPPFIVTTEPANGATGVPLDADINVTFSEAMDTLSVSWTISPTVVLMGGWNSPTDTVLTLSHTTPFQQCTDYTVTIATGKDLVGLDLVAGPVPNPWTFTSYCSPSTAPANLQVSIVGGDIVLVWDPVPGAVSYPIYRAPNRFAAFPAGWSLIGSPASSPFTDTGVGTDPNTYYYIVRASDGMSESPNSTMGVKVSLSFTHSTVNTNIAWFSLPYVSKYSRARDIVTDLGSANIDLVGKWDPILQRSIIYYFARGKWRGTDFLINAGDGLYLGIRQSFSWPIAGTDQDVLFTFTPNPSPRTNIYWIGIPFTGVYTTASDISDELTSGKIHEVGKWDPASQSSFKWTWTGTMWTGVDFSISPGDGIYVIIIVGFTWTPILITPAVP